MGLLTIALAFGAGYVAGRPDGRQRLAQLAKRPEVTRLRERGWDVAGERMLVMQRIIRRQPDQSGPGRSGPVESHGPGWRRPRPDPTATATAPVVSCGPGPERPGDPATSAVVTPPTRPA